MRRVRAQATAEDFAGAAMTYKTLAEFKAMSADERNVYLRGMTREQIDEAYKRLLDEKLAAQRYDVAAIERDLFGSMRGTGIKVG